MRDYRSHCEGNRHHLSPDLITLLSSLKCTLTIDNCGIATTAKQAVAAVALLEAQAKEPAQVQVEINKKSAALL